MRIVLYIVLVLLASNGLHAQDTLYMEDGTKKMVRVLELKDAVIRYKLPSNPDGPTYVVTIEDVKKIVYENGSVGVFFKGANQPEFPVEIPSKPAVKQVIPVPQKPPKSIDIGRNFISVNVLQLMVSTLTLGYEHTLASGNNSLKFSGSLGYHSFGLPDTVSTEVFEDPSYPYDGNYHRYRIFSVGVDYYKYPHGKSKAKYFYGPAVEYGQFNFWNLTDSPDPPHPSYYQIDKASYYVFLFQNGFLFHPTSHFAISVTAGIGYFQAGTKAYNEGNGYLVLKGGLNIGYNF